MIAHSLAVARRQGRPCLTHDVLAQAVDELAIGEGRKCPNPFRTEVANPRPADAEMEAHVPRVSRGGRRGAKMELE